MRSVEEVVTDEVREEGRQTARWDGHHSGRTIQSYTINTYMFH